MSIAYSSSGFNFVNSITGTGSNKNLKSLVPIVWDKLYHKQVQDKLFWKTKNLIGNDTFSEGSVTESASGYPVIRKTDLSKTSGDHIVMGQLRNLTVDPFHSSSSPLSISTFGGGGQIGSRQLVDAEQSFDFYHKKVMIDRQREGVRTDLGMNKQRNPYKSLEEIETELLSDWSAQTEEKELWFALHWGQSPHVLRNIIPSDSYDLTSLPNYALRARMNVNTLVGHDETMTTYTLSSSAQTQMNTSDTDFATWRTNNKISPKTFEIISAFARKNNWDFVMIDGKQYICATISPQAELVLRNNSDFRQAAYYAAERGKNNPIFAKADYVFSDVIVYVHNAVNDIIGAYKSDSLTGVKTLNADNVNYDYGLTTAV